MVRLLVVLFILVFYVDYLLVDFGQANLGRMVPEAFSGLILLVFVVQLMFRRNLALPLKYIVWFVALVALIIISIVVNDVNAGAVVMGIRENFKYAPVFLLPLVYRFSSDEMKWLLLAVLGFALLQFPMMAYQRLTSTLLTGDYITGTLHISTNVSVFLIAAWGVAFGFYLRKQISVWRFAPITVALLGATMLNETKGSLALMPLAFLLPLLFTPGIKNLIPKLMFSGALFVLVAVISSTVSQILLDDRFGRSMVDFFLNYDAMVAYFLPSTQGGTWIGRGDALLMAWQEVSQNWLSLMIGVGFGNTNETSSSIFASEYALDALQVQTGLTLYLWELGILGVLLTSIVPIMSYRDARALYKSDNMTGYLATGWTAVCAITMATLFYIIASETQAFSYVFWLFAGYLASENHYRKLETTVTPRANVATLLELRVATFAPG